MKLWFQVLFAQGYLLRQLFPDDFREEHESTRPNLVNLVLSLLYVALGLGMIFTGSPVFGSVLTLTGLAWAIWSGDSLGLKRCVCSRAFWTSLSWASGTASVIGWFLIALLSAIFGMWLMFGIFAAFFGFFGTISLRLLQRRYLYFSQRSSSWDTEPIGGNIAEWYVDAYWRLPREVGPCSTNGRP